MSRSVSGIFIIVLALAVFACGCGKKEEPAPGDEPAAPAASGPAPTEPQARSASGAIKVKIGVVIPLTGIVATYGDEARKGIMLAADQARAAGKVDPELITVDNAGTHQQTVTTVKKFIHIDKVDVIIGAITTNNTLAAGSYAEAAKVPLVTPAATNIDITRDKQYVFRVCFTDDFQGLAAANFAYDTLGARRAAVLMSSSQTYSMGLGTSITAAFRRRGGQIVSTSSFTSDTDDFGGQITRLRAKNPDVIFMPAYYEAAAKCISQARAAGLRATFVGTDGWDSPKLYTLSGGAVRGNYFTTHFSPDDERAIAKDFVREYTARYGAPPGAIAALSYDAARLVFDAVERAGKADREAITDALAATRDFEGPSGKFSMDENHNPVKSLVVLETGGAGATLKEVVNP